MSRLVVVLGMHRSGTSAMTRGLKVLGVEIGENLLPSVQGDNDKGFWEDLEVQALNVALMTSLGHRWDSLKPIGPRLLTGPHVAPFAERACAIVQEKTVVGSVIGVKDPRMSRLLPFWREVLGRLELPVGIVIALRNPLAVARSLERRDGFDITKSAYLWLLHMYDAVRDSHGLPRLVVRYDDILIQPREQLARIAKVLHLQPPEAADEALREYSERFLDRSLQHNEGSLADLETNTNVPPVVVAFYRLLLKASTGDTDLEGHEADTCLRQVGAALAELEPLLLFAGRKDAECLTLASLGGRHQVLFQAFPNIAGSYTEATAANVLVDAGETRHVVMELPQGSPTGAIRVDPADEPCVVQLDRIVVKRLADGAVIASWFDREDGQLLSPVSDLVRLPADQGVLFLSTGTDPQFLLPELDPAQTAQPLVLEAWVRVEPHLTPAIAPLLDEEATPAMRALFGKPYLRSLAEEEAALLRALRGDLELRLAARERELRTLNAALEVVYQSRSWRSTAPLRRLARAVRSGW